MLLSRFSRITTSGRFIPEVDGLRFIAIWGVIFTHLATFAADKLGRIPRDPLYIVASQGLFGVHLFFVISGFILSLPFAEAHFEDKPRPLLSRYYGRRLTRLEPPYFINLAMLLAMMLVLKGFHSEGLWPHFLASLAYLHGLIYGEGSSINSVAWSLEVEVQFYVVAPLLGLVFSMKSAIARRTVLIGLVTATSLISDIMRGRGASLVSSSLAGYIQYFLLGFLLTEWYLVDRRCSLKKGHAWDLLGVLAWGAMGVGLIKVATPRTLLLPLILIAYMAAFRGRLINFLLCQPFITMIGGMCYTIYLYHYQIMLGLGELGWIVYHPALPFWVNFLWQLVLLSIPLVIVSGLLFVSFERPFMRPDWFRRR